MVEEFDLLPKTDSRRVWVHHRLREGEFDEGEAVYRGREPQGTSSTFPQRDSCYDSVRLSPATTIYGSGTGVMPPSAMLNVVPPPLSSVRM